MTYEIGQKVTTPHGDGVIISMSEMDNEYEVEYLYNELTTSFFGIESLQPYRTPHEKLIEMGYVYSQISEDKDDHYYNSSDGWIWFSISNKNYRVSEDVYVDLELSLILTQYLEEMVE